MIATARVTACAACLPDQAPVFRELYSEKRVVAEERRARIDNAPMGRFQVPSKAHFPHVGMHALHRVLLATVMTCLPQ